MNTKIYQLLTDPTVAALRFALASRVAQITEEAITVQKIPAPTFQEGQRAAYVRDRFAGLDAIEIDNLHNVYARLPGIDSRRPAILVTAHTDTVFDAQTTLSCERSEGRLSGPGIGDNSLGVAALLGLTDLLRPHRFQSDIWFVANSREEGLGDLGGIRGAYEKLAPKIGTALVIEGMAFGRIYHAGIAVRRLKISCSGQGGHSWLHYGRPSAIHGLMQLGSLISGLIPPTDPRTTFNIGMIEGGRSVNSIATDASMLLDMRSEEKETLAAFERMVMAMVNRCQQQTQELTFRVEVVGDRPSGRIPTSHSLVRLATEVLESIGTHPIYENGSTDANMMLASGIPTVTIGITHGGNAHRLDEYIETARIGDGLWQLLLLTVALASGLGDGSNGT